MTRFPLFFVLGSGLLIGSSAHAQQARPANTLNQKVAPLTGTTAGAALLELAKSADINLLADLDQATAFKETRESPLTLRATLNRLSNDNGWSWRRLGGQLEPTFLLWKQPDALALARQIYAAPVPPVPIATAPVSTAPPDGKAASEVAPAPVEPLHVALTRFLAARQSPTGAPNPDAAVGATTVWRDVPWLELPLGLRERIVAAVRPQGGNSLQQEASGAVLGDEFWKTAQLKIVTLPAPRPRGAPRPKPGEKPDPNAPKQDYLFVSGRFARANGGATTMLSLGRWPVAEQLPFPDIEF